MLKFRAFPKRYEKEKMKIKKLTIKLYFIIFTFEVTIERA